MSATSDAVNLTATCVGNSVCGACCEGEGGSTSCRGSVHNQSNGRGVGNLRVGGGEDDCTVGGCDVDSLNAANVAECDRSR